MSLQRVSLTSLAADACVATAADTLRAHTRSSVQTLCPQTGVDTWRIGLDRLHNIIVLFADPTDDFTSMRSPTTL